MKKILLLLLILSTVISCQKEPFENDIIGTWEPEDEYRASFTIKKSKAKKYESYEMRPIEYYLSLEKVKVKTNLLYTSDGTEHPAFIENDKLFRICTYEKDFGGWLDNIGFSPGDVSQIEKEGAIWHQVMGKISMPDNDVLILTVKENEKEYENIYHRVK